MKTRTSPIVQSGERRHPHSFVTLPASSVDMSYFVVTLSLREMERNRRGEEDGTQAQSGKPGICPWDAHLHFSHLETEGCVVGVHVFSRSRASRKMGEGGVDCQAGTQPSSPIDRGLLGWIQRRSMALFCRASGEALLSIFRTTKNRVADRFLYVCEVVRLRQSCEANLQKGGGPECRI